jgi:LmbE family N-acetylglucosaminyl deacetylase
MYILDWNVGFSKNVNALVLVAHPDDETLFCGGTMLTYPSWNWTIICVTMKLKTQRPKEFAKAISLYRDSGVNIMSSCTLGQKDVNRELNTEEYTAIKSLVKQSAGKPDIVFTHNSAGDYGHAYHKELNKIAGKLFTNIWEFICPGAVPVIPQPFRSRNNVVPLSEDILDKKRTFLIVHTHPSWECGGKCRN